MSVFRPQINADDWTLIISKTELGASGSYQCSVNTLPKISHSVGLEVEEDAPGLRIMQDSPVSVKEWGELEARIEGPKTQYVSQARLRLLTDFQITKTEWLNAFKV